MQVLMHQEGLVIVGTVRAYVPASDTDFRNFLTVTLATIQDHRDRAEDVLRGLH
jgi:hypothetical protein